jgi:hypothetical protein
MSTVNIGGESLPEWCAGNGTVGTAPAQIFPSAKNVVKYIVVRANAGNSGTISLGPAPAQADAGFILAAGDTSPRIYVNDLSKVWLVGSDAAQAFSWMAF